MCKPSVIFSDNHLLVVRKPAGFVVQGTRRSSESLLCWARDWVADRFNKKGNVFLAVVHRLDKPVSGVVVFARTGKAASRLSEQIRSRKIEKVYLAVIEARIPVDSAKLEHRLIRGDRRMIAAPEDPRAKDASLSFEVLGRIPGASLVRVRLHTGRRHQIRAQFATDFGPVYADRLYGGRGRLPGRAIALLSESITVKHPTRDELCTFSCQPPRWWPWPGSSPMASMPI